MSSRSPGLARAGTTMAIGTVASRGTGFLRTLVLVAAVGVTGVSQAYNVANSVPNALYDLLLGGVLSSVVVPLLVQAARDDDDEGVAYAQRLLTLVTIGLTVVAVVLVVAAPLVVSVYAHDLPSAQRATAITFARYFLPQIVFYGLGAAIGAILNLRGRFAAPMWAPVLNNVVVIVTGAIFVVVVGRLAPGAVLSHGDTLLLAVGTTAGVVLQTVALLPALRRAGFPWRWRVRRPVGRRVGPHGRTSGFVAWVIAYVVTNQVGFAVVSNLATAAYGHSVRNGGFSAYSYAYIVFQLPYAVIAVSVITALFPTMSRAAAAGNDGAVRATLAQGLSVSGVLLVPATAMLLLLGPDIGTALFHYRSTSLLESRTIGATLAAFGIGLVPFSAFQIQLRAWLALRDSRTPALVNLAATAVNLFLDVVLYELLPGPDKVIGLAVGFTVSYLVGAVGFGLLLRSRLAGARPTHVLRTHVRLGVATVVAAIPIWLVSRALSHTAGVGNLASIVAVVVSAAVGGLAFALVARRLRVTELDRLLMLLPLGRRAG